MRASRDISAKHEERRRAGLDLGAALGPEADAGAGGRVQAYEHGRIYWHPSTGAHEVHGAILELYRREGGPGDRPNPGERLGYPVADEQHTEDGVHRISRFERGDILLVDDMGVAITGPFRDVWRACGGELGALLLPLCAPLPVAGGEAVYFERGCLWRGPASNGEIVAAQLDPPLLGKPALISGESPEVHLPPLIRWLPGPLVPNLGPDLLAALWQDRLALRRVQTAGAAEIPLLVQDSGLPDLDARIASDGPVPLQERALYDLVIRLPGDRSFVIAPHSYYVKNSWHRFGFIHATDIHVAKRIEDLSARLASLAESDPAMRDAAKHFVDFNDNFRDLIRYANRLHDLGLLDLIIATGDVVDYAFEEADQRQGLKGGNFAFLEALVRGKAAAASGAPYEELRVPIYTVFGNHDYRINPYRLLYEARAAGGLSSRTERLFAPYDLLEDEVEALQGGKPVALMSEALAPLQVDRHNASGSYDYYRRRINGEASYVLALGDHRIVMIDAGPDAGIPTSGWSFYLRYAAGTLSVDIKQLLSGRPNLEGFGDDHLGLLRTALAEASADAIVVVGVHAPPINIRGSEFAPFFRESQRAGADRRQLVAYSLRQALPGRRRSLVRRLKRLQDRAGVPALDIIDGRSDGTLPDHLWDDLATWVAQSPSHGRWLDTGTVHFMSGIPDSLLSDGVTGGANEAFMKICTGVDVARPVDLVLCGHAHDRVEYRVAWQEDARELRYFMDFYLENPRSYYSYREAGVDGRIHLQIHESATSDEPVRQRHDHRYDPPLPFKARDIPPFAEPLHAAASPRSWWQKYRPLIVETAPLGPIDRSQRVQQWGGIDPSFAGFRLFQVDGGVIEKGRYITLEELRANSFAMPFEAGDAAATAPLETEG